MYNYKVLNKLKKYGKYIVDKYKYIKKCKKGWYGGIGTPLLKESEKGFNEFIIKYNKKMNDLSLYMTWEGEFCLDWEGSDGECIEIVFKEAYINYHIEKGSKDGSIKIDQINELIKYLS
jgi:hypothetical protein